MELWDVYDRNRGKTGRFHRRGKPLPPGDYHLVIHVWIGNGRGEYLIQRRSAAKELYPGYWDCAVAGSALAGDDSRTAALRETREELGLFLDPGSLRFVEAVPFDRGFDDIWYTELDIPLSALTLQAEEVADVRWATEEDIRTLAREGFFIWYNHYDRIFTL